jgi:hypothetical protein
MRRAAHWPRATIHTPASLQRINRRLTRRSAGVTQVLSAMEHGAALHLHFQNGRAIWRLSTGAFITTEIADAMIQNARVVGVGDSLFPDYPSQTWRFCE